jgi:hypothetical protein
VVGGECTVLAYSLFRRAMVAEWSKRTMFTQVLDHSPGPAEGSNPDIAVCVSVHMIDELFELFELFVRVCMYMYMDGIGSNGAYKYFWIAI